MVRTVHSSECLWDRWRTNSYAHLGFHSSFYKKLFRISFAIVYVFAGWWMPDSLPSASALLSELNLLISLSHFEISNSISSVQLKVHSHATNTDKYMYSHSQSLVECYLCKIFSELYDDDESIMWFVVMKNIKCIFNSLVIHMKNERSML